MTDKIIARIVVAIYQYRLENHFADPVKLKRAIIYATGKTPFDKISVKLDSPTITGHLKEDELLELFNSLYDDNFKFLVEALEYLLNDYYSLSPSVERLLQDEFRIEKFVEDLRVLGLEYDRDNKRLLSPSGHAREQL